MLNLDDVARPVESEPEPSLFAFPSLAPPTVAELDELTLTPRCLVHGLLFADLRLRIAPGGVGKTTLALYEGMMLALGRPVWGFEPIAPANTLIVTREDPRSILLARLRELMNAAGLTYSECTEVLQRVRVLDLSSLNFRLCAVVGDVVLPNRPGIDELLLHLHRSGFRPDWLIFDPAVSLGVGEARVNDGEQGLIEAGRLLRNELGACVEFIHHSGKANARDGTLDQYSGRGGSAFSDGARMVAVLQPVNPETWLKDVGIPLVDGESGLIMALPKTSYSPPIQPIYIRRRGWTFELVNACPVTPERSQEAASEQVLQFIRHEAAQGRRYSQRDLSDVRDQLGLSKNAIAAACAHLRADGLLVDVGQSGKKTHLEPVPDPSGQVGDFHG